MKCMLGLKAWSVPMTAVDNECLHACNDQSQNAKTEAFVSRPWRYPRTKDHQRQEMTTSNHDE